ncbi:MAG: chemotaxis-specific protein-glutamate methyltransferase CheB [Bacteroidales bacterium]
MNHNPEKIIRVLVVDDSAYIRKVMRQMLDKSPFIEVVGTAINGLDALEKVELLDPDVITLDLIMPEMDGVSFLKELMKRKPKPVVVASIASESGELAMAAMEAGAIEFIQKPTALATEKVFEISSELIEKVKSAAQARLIPAEKERVSVLPGEIPGFERERLAFDIVVIGVSTGGPQALKSIIPLMPADFPVPVCVVMHMPVGYTSLYAQKLNEISAVEVLEASVGMQLLPGRVILGQAGEHFGIKRLPGGEAVVTFPSEPTESIHKPSVNVLFRSAAEVFGQRVLGVVMTGMGNDGQEGAAWIKARGGKIITQDEDSCVVYGMPRSVLEAGLSDKVVPLNQMLNTLIKELLL